MPNRRGQVARLEVPLPGHIGGRNRYGNLVRRRPAQQGQLGVGKLPVADLYAAHVSVGHVIAVTVGDQQHRVLPGTPRQVQTRLNPVLLLDAVDELGDDGRVGRKIGRQGDPVPDTGCSRAFVDVYAGPLTYFVALPEDTAVGSVVGVLAIKEGGRA